jgi:hypothetical protein
LTSIIPVNSWRDHTIKRSLPPLRPVAFMSVCGVFLRM